MSSLSRRPDGTLKVARYIIVTCFSYVPEGDQKSRRGARGFDYLVIQKCRCGKRHVVSLNRSPFFCLATSRRPWSTSGVDTPIWHTGIEKKKKPDLQVHSNSFKTPLHHLPPPQKKPTGKKWWTAPTQPCGPTSPTWATSCWRAPSSAPSASWAPRPTPCPPSSSSPPPPPPPRPTRAPPPPPPPPPPPRHPPGISSTSHPPSQGERTLAAMLIFRLNVWRHLCNYIYVCTL